MSDRRQFLGLATGACVAGLLRAGRAEAATRLTLAPLTGRLSLVLGGATNIVVASSGAELVLVDGGAAADAGALQKLLAKAYPGQALRAVFNTHWHLTHTGFNATARKLGADVIAHENARQCLGTAMVIRAEKRVVAPQPAAALPNRTFHYGAQRLAFGGTQVEYGHLGQAHTDGDIYVRFPEENVIVTGGAALPDRYPVMDVESHGWLGGIHGALRTLAAMGDAGTRYVPGLGPVANVDALKQQQEMCFAVLTRIGETYYKGQTFQELLAGKPTQAFDARYGDPSQFLQQAWDTAWYHVNEIRRVAR